MARTVPGSPGRPIAPRRTTRAAPYTNGEASAAGRFTGAASRSRRRFARSAAAAPFARQAEHRASDSPSSAPPQSTHWRPRAFSRHRRIAAIRRRRQTSQRFALGRAGRRRHRLQRRTTAPDCPSPGRGRQLDTAGRSTCPVCQHGRALDQVHRPAALDAQPVARRDPAPPLPSDLDAQPDPVHRPIDHPQIFALRSPRQWTVPRGAVPGSTSAAGSPSASATGRSRSTRSAAAARPATSAARRARHDQHA